MSNKTYSIIGLMSGTSLDGLDIAFCTFALKSDDKAWNYKIIESECIKYSEYWVDQLKNAHILSGKDLLLLHHEYGKFIGQQVINFIAKYHLKPELVSSHGHTIFHEPGNNLNFQLGNGAAIYAATNIPVVCDFRSVDISLGGQGAPLVPIGDELLFQEYEFCLNLGGIANISYKTEGKRIAYDICGCNLLLNALAQEKGLDYDNNGALAKEGNVNNELLKKLNSWDYLHCAPPKSLDKETMLTQLMPAIKSSEISIEDKLATVVQHIAVQIGQAVSNSNGKMLITGGGVFNEYLIDTIKENSPVTCIIPDDNLIAYKEALAFAFLGLLRVRNEINCLASVTGASRDSISGSIFGPVNFANL